MSKYKTVNADNCKHCGNPWFFDRKFDLECTTCGCGRPALPKPFVDHGHSEELTEILARHHVESEVELLKYKAALSVAYEGLSLESMTIVDRILDGTTSPEQYSDVLDISHFYQAEVEKRQQRIFALEDGIAKSKKELQKIIETNGVSPRNHPVGIAKELLQKFSLLVSDRSSE